MAINLTDTYTLLEAVKLIPPKPVFLRDRYFPTEKGDLFSTEDVIVEYKDEAGRTLAPAIVPYADGIPVARQGYSFHRYTPPMIAPERVLTIDHLGKRQFGEAINSSLTPAQREAAVIRQDLIDLNEMIDTREEQMAASVLINNGYTLKQYADRYGDANNYIPYEMFFYDEASNPAVYTCNPQWTTSGDIGDDIRAMAQILKKRGLPATDLILGSDAAEVFQKNTEIRNLLDNRRIVIADQLKPQELPNGATFIGQFNFGGTVVNIYSYVAEYQDESGQSVPFIPAKYGVMTAPGMGRTAYGAVSQYEQADLKLYTYEGKRIPYVHVEKRSRTLTQQSRPLVMPKVKNSAIASQLIA